MNESISYARLGQIVDGLLAAYPDLPKFYAVDLHPELEMVRLYMSSYRDVLAWAQALGAPVPEPYGKRTRVQADFTTTVDNISANVIGGSECLLGNVAHEHATCLEMARAEASAELVGSVA